MTKKKFRVFSALAAAALLAACLSPMHHAAERGDVDQIRRLAAAGADPNSINDGIDRWTPLLSAVLKGQEASVRALLEAGADPAYVTGFGTARQFAVQRGQLDIARVLKEAEDRKRGVVSSVADVSRAAAQALTAPTPTGHIGLALGTTPEGAIVVASVFPGTSAAAAGLRAGDRVVAVGERTVQTLTLLQTASLLRGEPGTTVSLTYRRGDAEPIMVALTRQEAPASAAQAAPAATAPASSPVSDIDAAAPRGAERPDDFALVIGVEEYQSLPKADYGVRDAEAARRRFAALGVPERNIIALEGASATKGKLQSYLQEWLPRNARPDSTIFIYYSGHGAPNPESGDAYLVPWDGDPMFLASTAYPLKQLYADLAKIKARRIVVALDACFSGAGGRSVLAKGARPLVVKVNEGVPASDNLTVLAAASGEEITGTLDDQGHGLFTYYFLKGLSGAAKNAAGSVTPRSLYDYLKPRVQDEARRQNREQTPTLAGDKGDEPLVRF